MLMKECPSITNDEILFISNHFKIKDSIPQNLIDINRFLKSVRLFIIPPYLDSLKTSYTIFEPDINGFIDPKEVYINII